MKTAEAKMSTKEYINWYMDAMKQSADQIDCGTIEKITDALFKVWQNAGTVYLMGNGGSASNASHIVNDMGKCTVVPGKKRLKVLGFTDNPSLITALVNDNGFDNLYSEQLLNFVKPGDALIGFSVHGGSGRDKAGLWSQNLLKAFNVAKENGCITIGFSGFDGGAMKEICDICSIVPFPNTQIVESWHLALAQLVCNGLLDKIKNS